MKNKNKNKNKKKLSNFSIVLVFTLSMLLNNSTGLTIANAEEVSKSSLNTIEDGAILHTWNWSFNTIKAKLPEIKEAGYKAIQTSPIQGTKEDSNANTKWWLLYQPTNFKIGNSQLGTREQFKSMCDEAEKNDIDVIVDVVANHTANRGGGNDQYYPAYNVDSSIKDDSSMWHEHRGVNDWNNRWEVTHLGISLPDLNTSNWNLQNKVIDFLNDAVECGADGFRFDAAKHIELPDDSDGSDFWPRVLGSINNKDNLFIYGEVLQGGADRIDAYHKYMKTTCDKYGGDIRSAVGYNSYANANKALNYDVSGNPSDLVTWVESHDSYTNDQRESTYMTNEQIKLGWAIIAARADSTPLYFNRTANGFLAGNIGDSGDDMWKDPIVVAANKFRNAMAGEGEDPKTQGNDLFINERGQKGVMIVNVSYSSVDVNCKTSLPDGQYKDSITGSIFNVSNGRLTGNIGSRTIATIYSDKINDPEVSSSVESGRKFVNSLDVKLSSKNTISQTYSIDGSEAKNYSDGSNIKLGQEAKVGDIITLTLNGIGKDGKTCSKEYKYEKVDKITNATARIELPSGWTSANIYVYDESVKPTKELKEWPGVAMTNEGNGVYSYTLPDGWGENTRVIFNNGSEQIPEAKKPGLVLATGSSMIYKNGEWNNYTIEVKDPEVSSSVNDGTEFTSSIKATLSAKNTTESTYSINGASPESYTDGKVVELGKDIAVGDTVSLTLTGKNSAGKVEEKTYSYKKIDKLENATARIKLPSGWTSANIYVYDESVKPTKEIKNWPGVAMTNEGNGIYSYTLPDGWGENTRVIFNNGKAQIPEAQKPGLVLAAGSSKIYEDGEWKNYKIEVKDPEVSSSVKDGTEFTGSIKATLSAKNTTESTYSIDGASPESYKDGTVVELGKDIAVGDTVSLTLTGKNSAGKVEEKTYSYKKIDKVENATARIKLPSGWTSANIYVYDESVKPTKEIKNWPGVAMKNEGNGIYSYTLPDGWGENTRVIFNNGKVQIPEAQKPGLVLPAGSSKIYDNGEWKNYTIEVKDPEVSSSAKDGAEFIGSLKVTLSAENTTESTYSINGASPESYTDGTKVELGKDIAIGDTVTLTLTGKNSAGKVEEKTYSYKKIGVITNATAKIKLPSGWTSANIYVYDESVNPTKELKKWPGVAMKNEGDGIYSYTLPDGWGENTRVIFNNGKAQIPDPQKPGFVLKSAEVGTYINGEWIVEKIEA